MTQDEFLQAFAEILEMPIGALMGTEKLEDIEHWDSLAMVSLIAMVDAKSGVMLSPRRIAGAVTVRDLYHLTQTT